MLHFVWKKIQLWQDSKDTMYMMYPIFCDFQAVTSNILFVQYLNNEKNTKIFIIL